MLALWFRSVAFFFFFFFFASVFCSCFFFVESAFRWLHCFFRNAMFWGFISCPLRCIHIHFLKQGTSQAFTLGSQILLVKISLASDWVSDCVVPCTNVAVQNLFLSRLRVNFFAEISADISGIFVAKLKKRRRTSRFSGWRKMLGQWQTKMHLVCLQTNPVGAESDDLPPEIAAMQAYLDDTDFYKMAIVVNTELTMGTGKVSAQVAHAAVGEFSGLSVLKIWSLVDAKWKLMPSAQVRYRKTQNLLFCKISNQQGREMKRSLRMILKLPFIFTSALLTFRHLQGNEPAVETMGSVAVAVGAVWVRGYLLVLHWEKESCNFQCPLLHCFVNCLLQFGIVSRGFKFAHIYPDMPWLDKGMTVR